MHLTGDRNLPHKSIRFFIHSRSTKLTTRGIIQICACMCHLSDVVYHYFKDHLPLNYCLEFKKTVLWLFLTMPRACLQFVIVVFPDLLTIFSRNDPYMALANNCTNGSSQQHILVLVSSSGL